MSPLADVEANCGSIFQPLFFRLVQLFLIKNLGANFSTQKRISL